jgi:hypothetical protein
MSFHQFNLLPTELRLTIWQLALPSPRLVVVTASVLLSHKEIPNITLGPPDLSLPPYLTIHLEEVYAKRDPLPPMFHACKEARNFVLAHHARFSAEENRPGNRERMTEKHPSGSRNDQGIEFWRITYDGNRPFILLDLRRDVLFLRPPVSWTDNLACPPLETLMRWIGWDIKDNLRSLFIPASTWFAADTAEIWIRLMEFKRLEELYVFMDTIPVGDTFPTGEEGLENEIHIERIRMGLAAWAKKYPRWKSPLITTVRHAQLISIFKRQGINNNFEDDVTSILYL